MFTSCNEAGEYMKFEYLRSALQSSQNLICFEKYIKYKIKCKLIGCRSGSFEVGDGSDPPPLGL